MPKAKKESVKETKKSKKQIKKAKVEATTKKTKIIKEEKKTEKKVKTAKKTVKKEEALVVDKVETSEEELNLEAQRKNNPPNENNPDEEIARKVIEENLSEKKEKQDLKTLKKHPQTMEELLSIPGFEIRGIKKGDKVIGTITDKTKRSVFFDIGAKTEALLMEKEIEQIEDYLSYLKVGDTIEVVIISPETDKGQTLVSLRKTANDWRWTLFEKYFTLGKPLNVRGLDVNKGGMIARVLNIRGFIPVSQFSRKWSGKIDQLYNKVFPVRIIEVDKTKNRLIFSEKAVSESEIMQKQQELLQKIKIGSTYQGEVSGVMPFGIFVRVLVDEKDKESFLDGLVHISEISWEKVNDVASIFKVGDKIEVQVLEVDQNTEKLNLSIKRLQQDPWNQIAEKYAPDTKIKAKVIRMAPYGAFVEVEKGIEGLIHISKIPSDMEIKKGEELDLYVESIDKESHRISLGVVLSAKPVGYK